MSSSSGGIFIRDYNSDKISWTYLSENPAIFTYDYEKMKQHMFTSGIAEGIIANRMHPHNADKWENWGIGFENESDDESDDDE